LKQLTRHTSQIILGSKVIFRPLKLPNFQLLINHDDGVREFAYAEKDNASLNAAKEGEWHVVRMKMDWKRIFPFN
jgi:hypothetical protein